MTLAGRLVSSRYVCFGNTSLAIDFLAVQTSNFPWEVVHGVASIMRTTTEPGFTGVFTAHSVRDRFVVLAKMHIGGIVPMNPTRFNKSTMSGDGSGLIGVVLFSHLLLFSSIFLLYFDYSLG